MTKMTACVRISLAALLLAGAAALMGCASDKPAAPAAAAPAPKPVSLAQIKAELLDAKVQMQATTDALGKLQQSSQSDAQANYNQYSEQYLKLQAKSDALKTRAENLKAKTAAYYDMWNKQAEVENPELRRQAVEQKADAEKVYNTVSNEMELARIAFNPLMSNLKDVGNYLRNNLTPSSLQSTKDLVNKADSQAKEVHQHIDAIVSAIDKMAAATGEGAGMGAK